MDCGHWTASLDADGEALHLAPRPGCLLGWVALLGYLPADHKSTKSTTTNHHQRKPPTSPPPPYRSLQYLLLVQSTPGSRFSSIPSNPPRREEHFSTPIFLQHLTPANSTAYPHLRPRQSALALGPWTRHSSSTYARFVFAQPSRARLSCPSWRVEWCCTSSWSWETAVWERRP